jgi:hypothetical protein
MIEIWLNECISKHERCRTRAKPPLPTYLVDVGDKDSHEVKLIQTEEDTNYSFVALSYVWGAPQQPIELRKLTTESMLTGIAEADIPRTILDAIKMTRILGFQYLWVDSFCIVQDDKVMKAGEISKMGAIFGRSILTIQAASAESVKAGFLHPRARGDVPEQRLRYSEDSDERVIIGPSIRQLVFMLRQMLEPGVTKKACFRTGFSSSAEMSSPSNAAPLTTLKVADS